MKGLLPLFAALALAAPAAAQQHPYRAHGTEPFWALMISGGRMTYEHPGEARLSVRAPRPTVRGGVRRYATRSLTVEISRAGPCSDGMSDFLYEDHVRVVADGNEARGCGGARLAPETLAHTSWRIVDIAGTDVSRADNYTLEFSEDRVSGRAGCNGFGGPYRVGRDGFQAGPLAMTRMACPAPRMQHERAVARILSERIRLYYPDGETLLMRAPSGTIRLRRVG